MLNSTPPYHIIGLMSGTSLDGLDIAYCRFDLNNNKWKGEVINAETIPYSEAWKKQLLSLETTTSIVFQQTHVDYGVYLGQLATDFIKKNALKLEFVSSHGHTIFHQPEKKLTVQIGSGSAIAAACKLPVVCDFRSLDVALGGQGAPLVPIGDKLLFSDFDFCLNLGGFANVSYEHTGQRIAYDICPVNIIMNSICERLGKDYDDKGAIAESGNVDTGLLNELNQLEFYNLPPDNPKSLGKEWVIKNIHPLLQEKQLSEKDTLRTFCEHIAIQIAKALKGKPKGKLLITGGGAYNTFLIDRIKKHTVHEIVIPDKNTIEFKEALIFAFLGVLRMRNEINCLKSVTGASKDNCGGVVYLVA
ncbi:MAG: anhydro-N-acetylmuramic acid kinase [Bacteroidota bacterium]